MKFLSRYLPTETKILKAVISHIHDILRCSMLLRLDSFGGLKTNNLKLLRVSTQLYHQEIAKVEMYIQLFQYYFGENL